MVKVTAALSVTKAPVFRQEYAAGASAGSKSHAVSAVAVRTDGRRWWVLGEDGMRRPARNSWKQDAQNNSNPSRSLLPCSKCCLTFVAARSNGEVFWCRGDGEVALKGKLAAHGLSRSFRVDWIEPVVTNDLERWLLNPSNDPLEKLKSETLRSPEEATQEAECLMVESPKSGLPAQRDRLIQKRMNELDDDTWPELIAILINRKDETRELLLNGKKKLTVACRIPGVVDNHTDTRAGFDYTTLKRVVTV